MGNAVFGGISSIYPLGNLRSLSSRKVFAVHFIGFRVEDFELPSEVFLRCKKEGCRSLFCRRMERLEKHRRGKGSRKALMKRGRQAARKRNAISVIEVHARARFPPDTVKPQAVRPRSTPSNRADAKYLPYMYSFKMQKAPSSSASPPYRPRRMRFFLRHGPSAGTGVFSFGLWFCFPPGIGTVSRKGKFPSENGQCKIAREALASRATYGIWALSRPGRRP